MPVRSLLSSLESQGTMLAPDALDLVQSGDLDPAAVEEGLMALDDLPLVVDAELARRAADGRTAADDGGSRADDGAATGGDHGAAAPPGSPDPTVAQEDAGLEGDPTDGRTSPAGPEPDAARRDADPPDAPPGDGQDRSPATPTGGPDPEAADAGGGAALAEPRPARPDTDAPPEGGDGAEAGLEGVADRATEAEEQVADEVSAPIESVAEVDYDAPDDALPSTDPVESIDVDDFEPDMEILRDVTGESTCEGELTDFTRYFNDRLRRLRKLLGKRREMVGMVPVEKANESRSAEITFAAMVKDVRTTSSGGRLIEAEDETGVALVFAPDDDEEVLEKADAVVEDEVVGFVANPGNRSSDLLILEDIVHPGVPHQRNRATADREAAVCFVSDVHVGAKTFLPDDWERFVRWINGQEGTPQMKRLARKVRYLVVAGDIVDGVGIFPGQRDELAVPDGEEQYRLAGEQLDRLRDDLEIVVSPGNHDLVRQAEPQPALPEKYAKHFPENVTQVANPCLLEIEGVRVLVYHGTGIDDWIQRVAGLSYQEPLGTMKEMLRRHHLLPMYGVKTPIAPEPRDHLVVDSTPDVFVSGHVHTAALESWRDVTLINSSCWQGQTPFQKRQGIVPEPGRAAVVELDSGDAHMLDFHRGGEGTA